MKKILLTLFTFVLALNAAAQIPENGSCGTNISWKLEFDTEDNATLIISGYGEMEDYTTESPSPWNKLYKVGRIWANYSANITKIVIKEGIARIGNHSFTNLSNCTMIEFQSTSLISIGSNAFYNCTSLTTIDVPESVTRFGTQVFSGCKNLTNSEHIIIKADLAKLEEDGTYTIPYNVKYIEQGAFDVFEDSETDLKYLIYQGCPKVGGDIAKSQIMNNITTTSVPSKDYNSFNVDKNGFSSYGNNVNTTKIQFLDNKYKSYTFLHDVSIPSGVAAYTAKAEGDAITLTKIKSGKVKAGEGILLKAEANGTYTFGNGIGAVDINENENHLVGVLKETSLDNGDNAYVLKTDQNDNIQKFYKIVSRINIGKFKAYLSAGESQAKTFSIFNDDTTNIEETEQEKEDPINSRTDIYNMSGQKLSTTQKGLNIVNGKIVIK